MPRTPKDYTSEEGKPNWCPGCGNFGIEMALKQAMAQLDLDPDKVMLISGIGCGSNMPNWFSTYGLITLHGRPVPVATGAHLANHELSTFVAAGDGDAYGIGMGHFIHAMRRNPNMVYIISNNAVYGLTKGQISPTAVKGSKGPSTPFGNPDPAVNPIALALANHCSFVGRGYAGNLPHLVNLFKAAHNHKGFALVDVLQPCVTYAKETGYQYYQELTYDLQASGHDSSNPEAAMKKAFEPPEKYPIGIFYQKERPLYEEELPQFKKGPLVNHNISNIDVTPLFEEYSF
jgi:2-oxoglutarate ferredoxin oxidoreductase subunit beta